MQDKGKGKMYWRLWRPCYRMSLFCCVILLNILNRRPYFCICNILYSLLYMYVLSFRCLWLYSVPCYNALNNMVLDTYYPGCYDWYQSRSILDLTMRHHYLMLSSSYVCIIGMILNVIVYSVRFDQLNLYMCDRQDHDWATTRNQKAYGNSCIKCRPEYKVSKWWESISSANAPLTPLFWSNYP